MLGMSLATIGRKVSALEDEIGLSLFYNDGRSVRLTHDGQEIYDLVHGDLFQLNNQIEGIKHIKKQISGDLKEGKLVNIFPNHSVYSGKLYSIRPNVYKTKKVEVFENFVLDCIHAFEKSSS